MKRIVLAYAAAGMAALGAAGCSLGGQKINHPFAKVDSTRQVKKPEYFEVRKAGTVYVLGSPQSLKAFNEGKTPAVKPAPDVKDKTVYVEYKNYTDFNRLVADYKKQHNL
jgi:hypothetical protein